jgi:hypothetical protein
MYNTSPDPLQTSSSEGVVLGRYLVREELVEYRNFLHDVVAHLGDLGEKEEGKEAGYTAESGCEGAAGVR